MMSIGRVRHLLLIHHGMALRWWTAHHVWWHHICLLMHHLVLMRISIVIFVESWFSCVILLDCLLVLDDHICEKVYDLSVRLLHLFHDEAKVLVLVQRLIFVFTILLLKLFILKLRSITSEVLLIIKFTCSILSCVVRLVWTHDQGFSVPNFAIGLLLGFHSIGTILVLNYRIFLFQNYDLYFAKAAKIVSEICFFKFSGKVFDKESIFGQFLFILKLLHLKLFFKFMLLLVILNLQGHLLTDLQSIQCLKRFLCAFLANFDIIAILIAVANKCK